jgi:magnesium transporter
LRGDLLLLRRAIWPHREAVNQLVRDPNPRISDHTRTYLRDVYDHTTQLIDLTETYREICSDMRDFYMSSVSNRMNEIMRVLTVIATIFIPLSFVVGIWGMNFDTESSPLNMPELKWYYGYPMAWAVMIAVAGGMLGYFYRRGWLGRQDRGIESNDED